MEYSNFKVDSTRWHGWDESRRRDHVNKLRKYKPTPSNYFQKQKNVGCQARFQKRDRAQEPDVIIDRIAEQSGSEAALCDNLTSCSMSNLERNTDESMESLRCSDPPNRSRAQVPALL